MRFLAAFRFLTVIQLPGGRHATAAELGDSLGYFPVVGIVIGLVLAGVSLLLGLVLPETVARVLLVIVLVLVTGAVHLDGLADTCDGCGGHTVEDRRRIMKDSRVGSFGVVGVFSVLATKYVSLASVPVISLVPALVLMPVVSRWAMVYAVFAYPYARPSGLGRVFKEGARWTSLLAASLVAVAVAFILARWAGLLVMLGAWLGAVVMGSVFNRRFGGLTGDNYGAINEVTETVVLILVSMLTYNQWSWLWWS